MINRLFALALFVWIGGSLVGSPAFSRAEDRPTWQTGLFFSYLTGDYGEDEDTEIYYGAVNVKRYYKIGDVTLTVPYLDISSDGATFVGGEVGTTPSSRTGRCRSSTCSGA